VPQVEIAFSCRREGCEELVEEVLEVSEPDFTAERMSDGDAVEDHDVACPACGKDYVVETWSSFGGVTANLGGEEIPARVLPDYDDYLLSYTPSSDTEADYVDARDDLMELYDVQSGAPEGILNRMVFSQLVALMEAYLSDKILRLVTDHAEIKARVVGNADFLKDHSLKLAEVLADPAKAESIFRLGLQKILYHDLAKVEKLYKIALRSDAFPNDAADRQVLEEAVLIRHDCVHRNGRRMDGTTHLIDDAMIRRLVIALNELVEHVEARSGSAVGELEAAASQPPSVP
jgi:hypothetical protein